MARTIQWLHLTDFHAGKDTVALLRMRDHIIEQLERNAFKPDLLFLTGDLAHSGKAEQYRLFWDEFAKPVQQAIGNSIQKRTFVVPGNHDVDRSRNSFFDRDAMVGHSSEAFDATHDGRSQRELLLPRFSAFGQYDKTSHSGAWASEQGAFSEVVKLRGMMLGIVGVNTAWLCKDNEDKERLTPGIHLLEAALKKTRRARLTIVLGHHPLDWIHPNERKGLASLLGNFSVLYLHGHLHDNWVGPLYAGENQFLSIQSRAAFQARDGVGTLRNGLMFGRVDFERDVASLQAWTWSKDQQSWVIAGEGFHDKHRNRDWWDYPLPGRTSSKSSDKSREGKEVTHDQYQVILRRKIEKLPDADRISNVAIRHDGCELAFSQDSQVFVLSLSEAFPHFVGTHEVPERPTTGSCHLVVNAPVELTTESYDQIRAIAYSRDGAYVISGDSTGGVNVWDRGRSKLLKRIRAHDDAITAIATAPNNNLIATASFDQTIKLWNLADLVTSDYRTTEPWQTITGLSNIRQSRRKRGPHEHEIELFQAVAFSPTGNYVASGDQKGQLIIREVENLAIVWMKSIHNQAIHSIEFCPVDEGIIATASDDTRIRVFLCMSGEIKTLGVKGDKHMQGLNSIAFSYDGTLLVSSGRDNKIKLWDFREERLVWEKPVPGELFVERVSFFANEYDFTSNQVTSNISVWRVLKDGGVQQATLLGGT